MIITNHPFFPMSSSLADQENLDFHLPFLPFSVRTLKSFLVSPGDDDSYLAPYPDNPVVCGFPSPYLCSLIVPFVCCNATSSTECLCCEEDFPTNCITSGKIVSPTPTRSPSISTSSTPCESLNCVINGTYTCCKPDPSFPTVDCVCCQRNNRSDCIISPVNPNASSTPSRSLSPSPSTTAACVQVGQCPIVGNYFCCELITPDTCNCCKQTNRTDCYTTPIKSTTPSKSFSPSISVTPSRTRTPSATRTITPSGSISTSPSVTPTKSISATPSRTQNCFSYNCQTSSPYDCCTLLSNGTCDCCFNNPFFSACVNVPRIPTSTPSRTPSSSILPSPRVCPAGTVFNPNSGLCCLISNPTLCFQLPTTTPSASPSPSFISPGCSFDPTRCPLGQDYLYCPSTGQCCKCNNLGVCDCQPANTVTATITNSPSVSRSPSTSLLQTQSNSATKSATSSITPSISPSPSVSPSPASPFICTEPLPSFLQELQEKFPFLESILSSPSSSLDNPYLPTYGNWCGKGHGGFQNCCNGTVCPACNITAPGTNITLGILTPGCIEQCPPVDAIDASCMNHDACTFQYPETNLTPPCGGIAQNYCPCDCYFVAQLSAFWETDYCGTTYPPLSTDLGFCTGMNYVTLHTFKCGIVTCFYNSKTINTPNGPIYNQTCSTSNGRFGAYNNCVAGMWVPGG